LKLKFKWLIDSWLDILLSLAILLTGFAGGVVAESKIGVYNRLNEKNIAQVTTNAPPSACAGTGSFALDVPWDELPTISLANDHSLSPAFIYGPDGPLRVQVFLDYECLFSQEWVKTVLPKLLERDDVRLEFYDFPLPFHPDAEEAAQAGRCAAYQGHYTEFLTALADYGTTNEKAITLAAGAAGLDVEKLLQCLPTQESNVKMNLRAAQEANIGGTPTTLINGRAVVGALPWETFERLIKEAEKGAP